VLAALLERAGGLPAGHEALADKWALQQVRALSRGASGAPSHRQLSLRPAARGVPGRRPAGAACHAGAPQPRRDAPAAAQRVWREREAERRRRRVARAAAAAPEAAQAAALAGLAADVAAGLPDLELHCAVATWMLQEAASLAVTGTRWSAAQARTGGPASGGPPLMAAPPGLPCGSARMTRLKQWLDYWRQASGMPGYHARPQPSASVAAGNKGLAGLYTTDLSWK
jgi:hypothetical protein